jgi:hypothetical protein
MDERFHIDCSVAFRSSGRATLKLYYTHHTAEVEEEMATILEERLPRVFSQAFQTIRDHPLPANIVTSDAGVSLQAISSLLQMLLGDCLGSLENLTPYGCDLRLYPTLSSIPRYFSRQSSQARSLLLRSSRSPTQYSHSTTTSYMRPLS